MTYPTIREITLGAMQGVAAFAFLAAGAAKLPGSPMMVAEFQAVGVGQWFQYLTCALEITGALALVLPRAVDYGAVLLVLVVTGVLAAPVTKLGLTSAAPALILLLITGIIAHFRRAR